MGSISRDAWINNYTWEKIASQYEAMYENLLRNIPFANKTEMKNNE